MEKTLRILVFLLLLVLFITGCHSNGTSEDIFDLKGSYVGNNSAVGSILNQLTSSEHLKGFELKTKAKPYGIILNYEGIEAEDIVKTHKETAIYNATYIFSLVKNVEWVTFRFDDQESKLTKESLQAWYGKELEDVTNEDELRQMTDEYLENEMNVEKLLQ